MTSHYDRAQMLHTTVGFARVVWMVKIRKVRYKVKRIYSPWKKKLLLLLLGGVVVTMAGSTKRFGRIGRSIPGAFKELDKRYFNRLIQEFYRDRLVDMIDIADEETRVVKIGRASCRERV